MDSNQGKLLVDSGWPGSLPKLLAELKRKTISPAEIKHLLVTHFYPDHAGLAQELKNMGARLILLESQVGFIAPFGGYFRKNEPYVEIQAADNIILKFEESRKFLASLAIDGEIIPTPGYSDDSITLILDEGLAFTGDLQPIFTLPEDDRTSRESWDRINRHKVSWIYPGHGR